MSGGLSRTSPIISLEYHSNYILEEAPDYSFINLLYTSTKYKHPNPLRIRGTVKVLLLQELFYSCNNTTLPEKRQLAIVWIAMYSTYMWKGYRWNHLEYLPLFIDL